MATMTEGAGKLGGYAARGAAMVALRLPDGVSKKIYKAAKGVPGAVKMGEYHATLAYLGDDLDEDAQKRTREAVKRFAANTPPLQDGKIDGTGKFEKGEYGCPLYAKLQAGGLGRMRRGLVDALGQNEIKLASDKPFVPHVTLAYLPGDTQSPELDMDHDGLQFDAVYLKMGGGDYEKFPLTGEQKAYDLGGRVDAVRSAWSARMRDSYGDDWWDRGATIEKVEDDAVIVKQGMQTFRSPYVIDSGRVLFGEMEPGALQFIPANPGELKTCTPEHARKMYAKSSDNRVLDVADGHVYFEEDDKCYRTAYSGEGDEVKFAKPEQVDYPETDDDDEEETKAGRRLAAPRISMLSKLQEKLADAVAQLNQVLTWAKYMDVEGKSFPEFLNVDLLAAWAEETKALPTMGLPPMYLKALSETDKGVIAGGYMAPWGAPTRRDLQLDFFRPETNFFLEYYPKAPAVFHHGKDPIIGKAVLGHRDDARTDDVGLWVQDWLDKSNKFWPMVKALLERRALYYSPGAAPHLVERDANRQLKAYPIVDDTFTPTPIQAPLLMGRSIEYIKSAYAEAGCELTFPEGFGEGATQAPKNGDGMTQEQTVALAMLDLEKRVMEAL